MESNDLINGQPFTLSGLLSGDRKIIMPDLQRDYCWGDSIHGDENNEELVSMFLESIIENQNANELHLGMIYAYENPPNHINLCDGQQRLTTLYLLLGMLYRKCPSKELSQCLISDFEYLRDDREPRLQYAIRDSTLYFLSDLVVSFFLENNSVPLIEINQQDWYFSEYDLDPSIQSIIKALTIIEDKLKTINDLKFFIEFLLKKIKILYFNVKNRENGEEMFVVINITGEPLTVTENLKPILIGGENNENKRKTLSALWENWETWFWRNKKEEEFEADYGLNEFFIRYWQIKLLQESDWSTRNPKKFNPIKLFSKKPENRNSEEESEKFQISTEDWESFIDLKEVNKYFSAYTYLVENLAKDERGTRILNMIEEDNHFNASYFRKLPIEFLLPLIEFCVKFPQADVYPIIRKLRKNYFNKKRKERNANYVDWRHVLEIIKKSHSEEEVMKFCQKEDFKNIPNVNNNVDKWYNDEERIKENLKVDHCSVIEEWEDHFDFMGDLSPLINLTKDYTFPNLLYFFTHYFYLIGLEGNNGKLFQVLKRIDDIKHKDYGYGYRGQDFPQDLYYTDFSTNILHTESWFKLFFKTTFTQNLNDQINGLLMNLLKTLISSATIEETQIEKPIALFERENSIFFLLPVKNPIPKLNFNWISYLPNLKDNFEDSYYNRALLIAILVYFLKEKKQDNFIGVAYKHEPSDDVSFNNLIGHYHSKAGSSYLNVMSSFANINEEKLIELLNSGFNE